MTNHLLLGCPIRFSRSSSLDYTVVVVVMMLTKVLCFATLCLVQLYENVIFQLFDLTAT